MSEHAIGTAVTVPSWTLRRALAIDVDAVAELWCHGWLDAHEGRVPDELVRHRRPDDLRHRVRAMLPATVTAHGQWGPIWFVTWREDEIEQLYVDRTARGSGAGPPLREAARDGDRVMSAPTDRGPTSSRSGAPASRPTRPATAEHAIQ